jgi:hypothetical protein
MTLILGIESSCDETAASVVRDGRQALSSIIKSQIDVHRAFGGVVPEIAAREHLKLIDAIVDQALQDADCTLDQLDAIAVTQGPGLIGALLVAPCLSLCSWKSLCSPVDSWRLIWARPCSVSRISRSAIFQGMRGSIKACDADAGPSAFM